MVGVPITLRQKVPEETKNINFPKFLHPSIKMWSALALNTKENKAVDMVYFLNNPSIWDVTEIIFLNDPYVEKNGKVRGIGEEADKMGTPSVCWTTDHFNHRAQLLYTKVGKLSPKRIYKRSLDEGKREYHRQ